MLPPGEHGPGAAALLRPEGADLFGLGTREAVLAALEARAGARTAFGVAVEPDELVAVLTGLTGSPVVRRDDEVVVTTDDPRTRWAVEVAAYAHGWQAVAAPEPGLRLRPSTP